MNINNRLFYTYKFLSFILAFHLSFCFFQFISESSLSTSFLAYFLGDLILLPGMLIILFLSYSARLKNKKESLYYKHLTTQIMPSLLFCMIFSLKLFAWLLGNEKLKEYSVNISLLICLIYIYYCFIIFKNLKKFVKVPEKLEILQEKPKIVYHAEFIFYATFAVGILIMYLEFSKSSQPIETSSLIMTSIIIAILIWFIYSVGKRKNWARHVIAIFTFLGIPSSISFFLNSLSFFSISGILYLAQVIGQVVAAIYLFTPAASKWFKKKDIILVD